MSVNTKLSRAVNNAQLALSQLELFLEREPKEDNMIQAAVIQAFEFTFETTWKLLQKLGEDEGVTIHSPRSAFVYGFRRQLWPTENPWLTMIRDRNLTVHTYNRELAEDIVQRIRQDYAPALRHAIDAIAASIHSIY